MPADPETFHRRFAQVLEYKKDSRAFPHQSTADQFFDEPQFESYRMLGSHIIDQLCGENRDELDLYAVITKAFVQLTESADGAKAADPQLRDWLARWLRNKDGEPQVISSVERLIGGLLLSA